MTFCFTHRYHPLKAAGLAGLYLLILALRASAQVTYNETDGRTTHAISTAVPFLRIAPDARSGALGGAGIALSPNANAVYWNLSKLPFSSEEMGAAVSYTPWLREMANDVYLAYLSAYKKLDDQQAIGGSIRFFDMGDIQLTDFKGEDQGKTHPREFSIDGGYARKLSDHWSLGVALRYIHSNLASGVTQGGNSTYKAGNAVAGDVSVYYQSAKESYAGPKGLWRFGATITNLGTKIGYTSDKSDEYFIPANLGIGAAYTYHLNAKNNLTITLDINKLLVPTPDTIDQDGDHILDYKQKSVVGGLFGSFGDARGGLKEEFHELMYSVGVEYWYDQLFSVRVGYYNEYKTKGNRKYVSAGIGLKYEMMNFDFSYLVPSGGEMQKNPLSNTLRFTLSISK